MDGALRQLKMSVFHALFRNGGGAIGQVNASGPSTVTFNLLEIEDVVNFEVGMNLQASAADGSTGSDTLLDAGATGLISAVNRDTGVITSATNWTATVDGAAGTRTITVPTASTNNSPLLARTGR